MSGLASRGRSRLQSFEAVWLAGVFICFAAISALAPPNGDDWAWGSQLGLDRLHAGFENYNGRYIANLVVIALTRVGWLAPLVVGASMTAIMCYLVRLTGTRSRWAYSLVTALLLAAPLGIWRQAITWLSGVVNYQFSALFVLMFLAMVRREWRRERRAPVARDDQAPSAHGDRSQEVRGDPTPVARAGRASPLWIVATAVGAFLMSLFLETVTIFFVVASLALLCAVRVVRRRWSAPAAAWLTGSAAGAAAMFSNGAYRRAVDGSNSYQDVGSPAGVVPKALDLVSRLLVVENLVLNIAIAAVIVALAVVACRRRGRGVDLVPAVLALLFVAVALPVLRLDDQMAGPSHWRKLAGVAVLLLLAAVLTAAFRLVRDAARRWEILCAVAAIAVLSAPTLVVSPIGPRLFFVTYVLMVGIVVLFAREVLAGGEPGRQPGAEPGATLSEQPSTISHSFKRPESRPADMGRTPPTSVRFSRARPAARGSRAPLVARTGLTALGLVISVALAAQFLAIYGILHVRADQRLDAIRDQVRAGATTVSVQPLPFHDYLHMPDPYNELWSERYKAYYGIPDDVVIRLK